MRVLQGGTFKQMLLIAEWACAASKRIYRSIVRGSEGEPRIKPVLRSYDAIGMTGNVDFTTTKSVYATDLVKSHLNYVVLDSDWEAKLVETLERMPEVLCYVKNQGLGFAIPYTLESAPHAALGARGAIRPRRGARPPAIPRAPRAGAGATRTTSALEGCQRLVGTRG